MISIKKIYYKLVYYLHNCDFGEFIKNKPKTIRSIKKQFANLKSKKLKFVIRYKKIPKSFHVQYLSNHNVKMRWEK
jgi:plasmid replication initiation protein